MERGGGGGKGGGEGEREGGKNNQGGRKRIQTHFEKDMEIGCGWQPDQLSVKWQQSPDIEFPKKFPHTHLEQMPSVCCPSFRLPSSKIHEPESFFWLFFFAELIGVGL